MEYQGTNAENIAQNSFRITQIRYAILGDKLFDEPNWCGKLKLKLSKHSNE